MLGDNRKNVNRFFVFLFLVLFFWLFIPYVDLGTRFLLLETTPGSDNLGIFIFFFCFHILFKCWMLSNCMLNVIINYMLVLVSCTRTSYSITKTIQKARHYYVLGVLHFFFFVFSRAVCVALFLCNEKKNSFFIFFLFN